MRQVVLWVWEQDKNAWFVLLSCGHWFSVAVKNLSEPNDSKQCLRCDPCATPEALAAQDVLSKRITDEIMADEARMKVLEDVAHAARELLDKFDAWENDLTPQIFELKRKYDLLEQKT